MSSTTTTEDLLNSRQRRDIQGGVEAWPYLGLNPPYLTLRDVDLDVCP